MYFLYCSKVVQWNSFLGFFLLLYMSITCIFLNIIALLCGASVYLYAESLLQWTADGRVQHFSAHQSWFICLISNSVLLVVCTLWSWDCASTSVLEKDYIAIQLDLSIQHAALLTFSFVTPDHHIATELHQFMLGEGPCKCCVLQSAAKTSPS